MPSVEEALKISQDFLEFAKEVRANNAIKEQQEEEKTLLKVKFIYSEKATKLCEIFPLLLTVCTVVKSKGKISQNFVAFSEYMNFESKLSVC